MKIFLTATICCFCSLGASCVPAFADAVSILNLNTAYTQNFNSLPTFTPGAMNNTTQGISTALPNGLLFIKGNGVTTYGAGTGLSSNPDAYSFGTESAPGDRAFGTLRTNAVSVSIGMYFTNNTGKSINELALSYSGEQYRVATGATNRKDQLDFAYSTDATSLLTGTYTDVDAGDVYSTTLTGPASSGSGNVVDPTLAPSSLSFKIQGLNIASGGTFYLKWTDLDIPGIDDGLAIDDFSITAQSTPEPQTLAMMAMGICALAVLGWKRKRSSLDL